MADKRMIESSIFEDEWFGNLNLFEKMMWIGIVVTMADDQGRFSYSPALIRSRLFPYEDIQLGIVNAGLDEIINSGKVIKYTKDGKELCQVINWWKHQNPSWAMPSRYPAPDGWTDRIRYHTTNRAIKEENWNTKGGWLPSALPSALPNGIEKEESKRRVVYDDFPRTPKDALQHPDIQVFQKASQTIPGQKDYQFVIDSVRLLRPRYKTEPEMIEDLARYAMSWQNPNRKNLQGNPYKHNGVGWLEWAINKDIPPIGKPDNSKPSEKVYSEEYL